MTSFSIITPVYNPPIWALKKCIQSVLSQTFADWEWCIADDCSSNPEVLQVLKRLAKKDKRVKVLAREVNGGIVEASNSALEMAEGEFLVLLDHDDVLNHDALSIVSRTIVENPEVDYLYSDEDKIDDEDRLFHAFKKPAFSPERLRGQNYCSHLSVFRHQLLKQVGFFNKEFEGAQDYDLILRVTEKARQVAHIPHVLYHWRVLESSTATDHTVKPYAAINAKRALMAHCERMGIDAEVVQVSHGYFRVRRKLTMTPKVSVVIPTRGDRKRVWGIETCLVANAVRSIIEKSSYNNFEIIIVHDSVPQLDEDLDSLLTDSRIKIVWYNKPFNFSDKCNIGVISSDGEIVLLLNDDTEIISHDWIESQIEFLEDPSVAMVGPITFLEDGRIQSAGHGNNPAPHNSGSAESSGSAGLFGERIISREVSGVTGACMAIRRNTYFDLGGMSNVFPHSFNDVDLAFKALGAGYRIIWTPFAQIWHFESLSRNPDVRQEELENLQNRWHRFFNEDKFTV